VITIGTIEIIEITGKVTGTLIVRTESDQNRSSDRNRSMSNRTP
jgi:hypothetical protein